MNHAQACAPLQREAAMQAIYQFLHDEGLVSSAEMLAEESSIPYDADSLSSSPATLLTALSAYSAQRDMAFKKEAVSPELQRARQWLERMKAEPCEALPTQQKQKLHTHTANIICCKWQPKKDSSLYAAGSVDKTIALCSADSNEVLRRIPVSGPVLSLHFNPAQPNLLLATCMNGGHSVVDIDKEEGAEVVHSLVSHKKYVIGGRWNPSGTHFATASHDQSVQVYAQQGSDAIWNEVGRLDFDGNVESVAWVSDSELFVSVREDNYLHRLRVGDAQGDSSSSGASSGSGVSGGVREVSRLNLNESGDDHVSFNVLDMAVSPNREAIMLATDRHRALLVHISSGAHLRNFYNLQNDGYSTPRLSWSPSGRRCFLSCQDASVCALDVASGRAEARIKGHEVNVRDVDVQAHTNRMLTCSFDKTCRVWGTEE